MKKMNEKPLEERLYDRCYKLFEKDKALNGNVSTDLIKLGKYTRYVCAAAALGLGISLVSDLYEGDVQSKKMLMDSGFVAAFTGLTIHMHDAKMIFEAMYKKNTGKDLTQKEISKVKIAGKIGRYSHMAAATAFLGTFAVAMTTYPLLLIMAPTLPFWYHITINKAYGSLYASAVDYVSGERKRF